MRVRTGLEVLLDDRVKLLAGRRVGLLAHPASVDSSYRHAVTRFLEHREVDLTAIFGPQHGARGETQDNMIEWEDYRDPKTGLPVYSLYGTTRKPTSAMLEKIDVLVVDLQDVGARYYTFIYTMALAMEACAETGKPVIVLDRPNPINGLDLEGPILDPHFSSFVGLYPIPVRHGMTIAELARLFNAEFGLRADLTVVAMEGWQRDSFFEETSLPWVLPSPNMPSIATALVYPGMCLLEGTNVSEGRGTTLPFEISGAPWVDPEELAGYLNARELPGVYFRPLHIQPTFHKWAGQLIGGVQTHVLDRRRFKPFFTGIHLVAAYRHFGSGQFEWKSPPYEYEYELLPFDILCGSDRVRRAIESDETLRELEASWVGDLESFRMRRGEILLY